MKKSDVKIGMKLNLGRNVIATVTGECKQGFTATQDYRGKTHNLIIHSVVFDNNHYAITVAG